MSFSGQIESFSIVDLMQYIHYRKSTGGLHFENSQAQVAEMFFYQGECIRASYPGMPNIGSLLLKKKKIQPSQLSQALKRQEETSPKKPLGAILEEQGFVTHEMVRETVIEQIENVIVHLMHWKEGHFSFKPGEAPKLDDIGLRFDNLEASEGAGTIYLILDAVQKFDAIERGEIPNLPPPLELEEEIPENITETLSLLKSMLEEFNQRGTQENVLSQYFQVLSRHMDRAIFFVVGEKSFSGVGGFGEAQKEQSINQLAKRLRVPLTSSRFLSTYLEKQSPYYGAPPQERWIKDLHQWLGEPQTKKILILPVKSEGKITAFVYGDNGAHDEALKNLSLLEMATAQVGILLENAHLRNQAQKTTEAQHFDPHPSLSHDR